jgi:hypothetical protein
MADTGGYSGRGLVLPVLAVRPQFRGGVGLVAGARSISLFSSPSDHLDWNLGAEMSVALQAPIWRRRISRSGNVIGSNIINVLLILG